MLALVEPCIIDRNILDRPYLGCAMLIAACQEKGIKTFLIKGQTRYLKDIFVNDSEEVWDLIQDLKEDDSKKIRIAKYKKSVQEKGIKQFQDELKGLYNYFIVDKNPRHYLNIPKLKVFNRLYKVFLAIFYYYATQLNYQRLKIIDRYLSEILKKNPHYIGFSLDKFDPLARIIRKRIKELTNTPIILGGSFTPFIDLKKLDNIFEEEYFDYLVIGPGEYALPSLIEALDNKKEPKGIANVFYKKDGKIKDNNLEAIKDLDSLPNPDYSQFDLDLYLTPKMILPLQTARGCSWRKCAFCNYPRTDFGIYRTFGIEKIINTITYLQITYDCQHFWLHDNDLPPGRAKRISEAILKSKLKNLFFYTFARLEDGFNDNKLLYLMHKAGFAQILWGMESGCQRVLNMMNKGTNVSIMSQILKKSSKNKISNVCLAFFGFPGETKKEAQETVEFLKEHSGYIDLLDLQTFGLAPFSDVATNPLKWGVKVKDDGSYSVRSGMAPEEVRLFHEEIMKRREINSIKVVSDKVRYFSDFHGCYDCILFALMSRLGVLSNTVILKYLKEGRLSNIFPIILGEIRKENSEIIFYPINVKENLFINNTCPPKQKVLDNLEEDIFVLSDGRLSIKEISSKIYKDFNGFYEKEYIHKKCYRFFHQIFSKNWGLGFAKSWCGYANR